MNFILFWYFLVAAFFPLEELKFNTSILPLSGRYGVCTFFSLSCEVYLKTLDITYRTNVSLKGREKVDCLGTWGYEEWHNGEFSGFSFGLMDCRLRAKEDRNLEMPISDILLPFSKKKKCSRKNLQLPQNLKIV